MATLRCLFACVLILACPFPDSTVFGADTALVNTLTAASTISGIAGNIQATQERAQIINKLNDIAKNIDVILQNQNLILQELRDLRILIPRAVEDQFERDCANTIYGIIGTFKQYLSGDITSNINIGSTKNCTPIFSKRQLQNISQLESDLMKNILKITRYGLAVQPVVESGFSVWVSMAQILGTSYIQQYRYNNALSDIKRYYDSCIDGNNGIKNLIADSERSLDNENKFISRNTPAYPPNRGYVHAGMENATNVLITKPDPAGMTGPGYILYVSPCSKDLSNNKWCSNYADGEISFYGLIINIPGVPNPPPHNTEKNSDYYRWAWQTPRHHKLGDCQDYSYMIKNYDDFVRYTGSIHRPTTEARCYMKLLHEYAEKRNAVYRTLIHQKEIYKKIQKDINEINTLRSLSVPKMCLSHCRG
jgi:hypothetical protein